MLDNNLFKFEFDPTIVFKSNNDKVNEINQRALTVSSMETTVLLTGETGTGKGIYAYYIHKHSKRRDNPFITVHCGAIPDTLLESELFGHEKGAFTGAIKKKLGKFEIADGGTIFLDEIGTITPALQIKLLQVLQDKTFQRVGGEETFKTDVRIIAATNSKLKDLVNEDKFRQDLYYRLLVFPLELPPLRDRVEDIPLFVNYFLIKLNKKYSKNINNIDQEVLFAMQNYSWPGNIRELENMIESAYVLETGQVLTVRNFPNELFLGLEGKYISVINTKVTLRQFREIEIGKIEEKYIKELLDKNKGRIKETAAHAGIGVRQLNKLLHKYHINKNDFKHLH